MIIEGNSSTPNKTQKASKNNNFNLIRLLLAFFVILSHSPELIDGNRNREVLTQIFHSLSFGQLAVDGFFLLSGYLIVQSWESAPQVWYFLQKRILRIYPAFILAALVCVFIVGPLGAASTGEYFSQFSINGFVVDVLLLKLRSPDTFLGSHYALVNKATWTIRYEFFCYVSVLAFGLAGLFSRRRLFLGALSIVVLLFAAQNLGYLRGIGVAPGEANFPVIRFYSFFFTGSLFYFYRTSIVYRRSYALVAFSGLIVGLYIPGIAEIALLTLGKR